MIGDVSASMSAGAVVVEMSSGVPSVTQALAADLQGQGVCLVDCPGQAMKALNNLDSGFGLDLMAKDLGIAVGMAREAGVAAPFSAICAELWASAGGLLGPGRDHTEMARFSEAIGGLELRGAPSDQEAERVGRSPQPTRGDLAPDQQLHSRPTGNAATARRADVTHPRTLHGR